MPTLPGHSPAYYTEDWPDWSLPAPFRPLVDALLARRSPVYVVGGAVRDALLGRPRPLMDLDLALEGPVIPLAREVADALGWAFYPLDEARDVARLIDTTRPGVRHICDLVALRGTIQEDLLSRDFTVNALAVALHRDGPPQLVDVCQGRVDLESRVLRPVTSHSLTDDPVRMVRAVRFTAELGFALAAEARIQIQEHASQVTQASPERIRDELWRALATSDPDDAVEDLRTLGLLAYVLPEVAETVDVPQSPPHHEDVYRHILLAVGYAAALRDWLLDRRNRLAPDIQALLAPWRADLVHHARKRVANDRRRGEWLVWFALFHDVGKPATYEEVERDGERRIRFLGHADVGALLTEQRLEALRFSRAEVTLAAHVVRHHMRPLLLERDFAHQPISRRAAFRFFRATDSRATGRFTGVDVLLLALADAQATGKERPPHWPRFLTRMGELFAYAFEEQLPALRPVVDGRTLMQALGLEEGPLVGKLIRAILEAQAVGQVHTPEEALAFARDYLRSLQLSSSVSSPARSESARSV